MHIYPQGDYPWGGMSLARDRVGALLRRAEELIEEARRTDYAMPTVLPFVPAILSPIAVLALLLGLLTAATTRGLRGGGLLLVGVVLLVVAVLLGFYVVYRWIRRRNEHFRRSLAFFEVVTEVAELLNLGRAPLVRSRLNELREVNSRVRDAVANTILIVVPLYMYYVFHFLNKDFHRHSERERLLLAELVDELRGRVPTFIRRVDEFAAVPERSTFLYLILTIATAGLFLLYWVYTLTKDPNKHFESHGVIERDILVALRELYLKAQP